MYSPNALAKSGIAGSSKKAGRAGLAIVVAKLRSVVELVLCDLGAFARGLDKSGGEVADLFRGVGVQASGPVGVVGLLGEGGALLGWGTDICGGWQDNGREGVTLGAGF
ncbi:hypothetical protein QAD02_021684 [Eretmocerus hayati]|uniref:Uncharacterized protein n=1 Tax=Eretmocerus hayati TaxID=131215 RepID=A0ACC2PSF4_9HYME|nr:hypothetical protein QAD02_021684 [Eretmocerus hayati]